MTKHSFLEILTPQTEGIDPADLLPGQACWKLNISVHGSHQPTVLVLWPRQVVLPESLQSWIIDGAGELRVTTDTLPT